MLESQSLKTLKNCGDVALRNVGGHVGGHGGDQFVVELDDLCGLFHCKQFYDFSLGACNSKAGQSVSLLHQVFIFPQVSHEMDDAVYHPLC